jgi:hypothetical protein
MKTALFVESLMNATTCFHSIHSTKFSKEVSAPPDLVPICPIPAVPLPPFWPEKNNPFISDALEARLKGQL